ncbi:MULTISPECIES: Ppx/GppA family phosphatase [unclassified Clostridium]|uniref:Ppx/GppA family phosphatase n=1 Tax=unclassified Clostridium TaxID=2614128 RepID=UPI0018975833|nr:Ppx/GppA family phosphatase [Clostridium sp.]MBP3916909.1 Ppx/GppA family phosphatase [Clostridium sp.]MEE0932593.1 Ppx/GppA family phosphatase [Clostridium sp.]
MERRAIIDIGSNSVRLIIYRIKGDSTFKVINEAKRTIRLGSYLREDDYLSESGLNILLKVLKVFKDICKRYEVLEIYVVATEAIRRSINKYDVCNKIKLDLGLEVNILSGLEEAKYGYLAIKNSMLEKNAVLLDLGGSSMEITLMENGEFKETISLPLGSIPLTKMFNNLESKEMEIELNKFIYDRLQEISWLKKNNNLNVIGIGGIAKHIGRVSKGNEDYPKELLHNYSMTRDEISKIYAEFLKLPIKERSNFKGLSKKRAEIFAAPLGAILVILKYFDSEKYIISAIGLREGIIYEKYKY